MIDLTQMRIYWNGQTTEEKEVSVSPWDLGFLRGYGVFDYIAVYDKRAFMLDEHVERLQNSARIIGLEVPLTSDELKNVIAELLEINDHRSGAVRIVLTGGVSENGISKGNAPTLLIRPEVTHGIPQDIYKKGGKLITVEYERELPRAKTTQYIEAIRHEEEMRKADAIEVLFVKNGQVSECSRSNIFMISNKTLITPKENVLLGITRQSVLSLSEELGVSVEERDISYTELIGADEVFITGTGKRIVPVVEIEGIQTGDGAPGVTTKKFMEAYEERTRNYLQ